MEDQSVRELTIKEERFCIEFIKDFNSSGAARRAKYSQKTSAVIGYENLRKPHIKNRIAELLEAEDMQEGEIKKRFTDIARTDMANYLVKKKVPYTPMVKIGLAEAIRRKREEIDFEDDYALQVSFNAKELVKHQKDQESRRREVIRMKLELERNPKAFRIVNGETEMIDVAELDLVKIADDKDRGMIKSIKHTKEGIQVEPYSADGALTTLAKFRSMLIDKSEVDLTGTMDTTVKVGYGNKDED